MAESLELATVGPSTIVVAKPHPLSSDVVQAEFPLGFSIAEILGPEAVCCKVEIGGMDIPSEWWPHVRPRLGVAVYITRFPQGGGGFKAIFRIIAFAALAVGMALLPGAGWFAGLTMLAKAGVMLGIGLGGSLLINAICPPQTPVTGATTSSIDNLQSLTGSSNQANPYGAIPCVFGSPLVYPTFAAAPFTELSGDDQYLRMLFDCGYGTVSPSDFQIGTSDLSAFTDVEYQVGTSPSLYSQDIGEVSVGATLNTDGTTATRTSAANADELAVDLAFPSGLIGVDSKGNSVNVSCKLRIEFSPTGAGTWTSVKTGVSGFTTTAWNGVSNSDGTFTVSNSARKVVRFGLRWKVTRGEYDIRVTRISTNWGSSTTQNEVGDLSWAIIRTIRYSVPSTTGTTKIALRIKATDQLNGTLNQFNCVMAQSISVWNGTAWVAGFSSNPAYLYRWLLRDCPGNPKRIDPSRIDDTAIIAWAAECDAREFTFDLTQDQASTVFAMLQDICAAGRASFTVRDGKYSIVRDIPQTTPAQIFTPRNTSGFSGSRAFPDAVHALRCQFVNPEASWQQDEVIVYDDGYSVDGSGGTTLASQFETMQFRGSTNVNGIWRLGRYHLAVGRLRPNVYTFNADIEHVICSRGDLVTFAHDVISSGVSWGRIKTVTQNLSSLAISITTDEQVPFDGVSSYSARIRRQDGTAITTGVTLPSGGANPGNALMITTPAANLAPGDLFLFGITGAEAIPLLVTKIEPSTNIGAKVTAVDYAPAIQSSDSGTPPVFVSQLTGQPWLDAPPPPSIVYISSTAQVSAPDDSGATIPALLVSVGGPGSGPVKPPLKGM